MITSPPRRSQPALPTTLAVSWLGTQQHSAQVLRTAQAMLEAQAAIQAALPPALAQGCRVARLDGRQMTLAVPSAPYASKLRQMSPRLVKSLNDAGWNLTDIVVRVQAGLVTTATKPTHREVSPLDEQALEAFDRLKTSLAPGPLATAIDRLLKHHRPR